MALFAVLVLLPMMAATLNQYVTIHREDGARMAYVREMAAQGATELEVAPISIKNRVLRHVYFEDLNNSVSRDLLCNYYGLKTIKLKEEPRLGTNKRIGEPEGPQEGKSRYFK